MLGFGTGFHEIRVDGHRTFLPTGRPRPFEIRLQTAAKRGVGCQVSLVPRMTPHDHLLEPSNVLWVRVENGTARSLLEQFEPQPTMILRDGDTVRMTALWALREPLRGSGAEPEVWCRRANERLSYALGGVRKHANPHSFLDAPGTPAGRGVVTVARFEPDLYDPREVVGHLPDAPSPDAWKEKQSA